MDAVLSDANVLQIIAGAGTGKTTTLVSKVKYLIEEKGVHPSKILCLSFSQKSALDLRKKLKKIGVSSSYINKNEDRVVRATTFHSFGYNTIKDYLEKQDNGKAYVYNNKKLNKSFEEFLKSEIVGDISIFENFKRYFYHIFNENTAFSTDDTKGVITKLKRSTDPVKGSTYQTIVSSHEVKSFNDLKIADFLLINNIDYIYRYEYEEEYMDGKVLQADFYLPQYDIYIEDFNLNDKGVPDWLKSNNQKREYKKHMEFIKGLDKNIILINSYHSNFLSFLEKELKNKGVKSNRMKDEEIISNAKKFLEDSYYVKKYFDDFISAFKEHEYDIEKFDEFIGKTDSENFFLKTVKSYYKFYNDYLERNNLIDFTDMILKATPLVKDTKYEYVLVDEYQDMSKCRFRLLKEILDDSGAKLIVVGDDWQSIYGFNGCEVKYFTDFKDEFKNCEVVKLKKTYRSSNELITAAGNFIDNSNLIKKELMSDKHLKKPIKLWTYPSKPENAKYNMVYDILKEIAEVNNYKLKENANDAIKTEVMILGRYKNIIEELEKKLKTLNTFGLDISFNTIHKVKGLEADNVIILDVNKVTQGKGIPSKVRNEGFQRFVSFQSDKLNQEKEERRVFYVGLTRTRNNVYLCAKKGSLSPFINELNSEYIDKNNYKFERDYFIQPKKKKIEKSDKQTTFD